MPPESMRMLALALVGQPKVLEDLVDPGVVVAMPK
jgi:hypothetical protein